LGSQQWLPFAFLKYFAYETLSKGLALNPPDNGEHMIPAHLQNRSIDQLRSTQETIRCFLVEPTGEGFESVIIIEDGACIGGFSCHRSERVLRRFSLDPNANYPEDWIDREEKQAKALSYCSRCGNHDFSPSALSKPSGSKGRVWERTDTGERADSLNDFGPGAMWHLPWYHEENTGLYWTGGFSQSEPPLSVRTPGGDWVIDSRASNCTLPKDDAHRCWPRQGVAPNITVGKQLGPTCGAGGGSIIVGDYHGFLRDGFLVKC
jgi:hypothetical protein